VVRPQFLDVHSSTAVRLDKTTTIAGFLRRPIDPQNRSGISHLIQGDTSSRVSKLKRIAVAGHLPCHLLISTLEISSRSAHREGHFSIVVGKGERCGCRRRDDVQNLWVVGDLNPKHLTAGRAAGLEQLHRIDLCGVLKIRAMGEKNHTYRYRKGPRIDTN